MNADGRRSIRLRRYDYRRPGAYFLTVCTCERTLLFDNPQFAEVASTEWGRSALMREGIELDALVVMPNHIHGIVFIVDSSVGAQGLAPFPERRAQGLAPLQDQVFAHVVPRSLGSFVRGYKSAVTVQVNALRGTPRLPVWQRNYYEHVVRDEADLERIRRYIDDNPRRWAFDRENPRGTPDRAEIEFWDTRR